MTLMVAVPVAVCAEASGRNGRTLAWGRWWCLLPWGYSAATVATVVGSWGARQEAGHVVDAPRETVRVLASAIGMAGIGACLVLGVAGVVGRYRSGGDLRREQIRWLLLAGSLAVALLMLGWLANALGATIASAYAPFLLAIVVLVPVAVGIAIVRHDLFDVDRLLGETTTWALTIVGAAMIFGVVVFMAGRLVEAGTRLGSTAAAVVSALAVMPLHRHLRAAVERVVDRDRYLAKTRVAAFAAEVRAGRRSPEDIEDVLRSAQGDPDLRLWLAHPSGGWMDVSGHFLSKADEDHAAGRHRPEQA